MEASHFKIYGTQLFQKFATLHNCHPKRLVLTSWLVADLNKGINDPNDPLDIRIWSINLLNLRTDRNQIMFPDAQEELITTPLQVIEDVGNNVGNEALIL